VASVAAATVLVVIAKVALEAPPATVTVCGTCAAGSLLARETTAPVAGAGLVRITVPVEGAPPITEVGFRVTLARFTTMGPNETVTWRELRIEASNKT
jgi:hypothetical protein